MTEKPLTKALHTTRVVEAIARHLCAEGIMFGTTPEQVFAQTLRILGNTLPVNAALYDQCIAACKKVLS